MRSVLTGLKLRLWPCLTLGLVLLALGQVLLTPCLTLSAEGRRLVVCEAGGTELTIDFIHSVQKTPVEEFLALDVPEIRVIGDCHLVGKTNGAIFDGYHAAMDL